MHERGATHVEVTEYGTGPTWFAWERSRCDWSEADRIRQTVIDSNVLEPGSTWELRVRPRQGGGGGSAVEPAGPPGAGRNEIIGPSDKPEMLLPSLLRFVQIAQPIHTDRDAEVVG